MPPQRLVLLCLLLSTSLLAHAETRHIHVIQLLDDNSPDYLIREGCRSISYGIEREVDRMKESLGISDATYYRLSGNKFNRASLEFVIDYELAYQERDIIIVVYAGHGFRDAGSQNQLPKLYFNGYQDAMEGDELRFKLLEKNPSVLINLVIACNTTQRDHRVAPGRPQDSGLNSPAVLTEKARKQEPYHILFSDQPGYTKVIDLISADREYETFMSRDGGIFFSEVLYAFQEVFADQRLQDWNTICSYITDQTMQRTQARHLRQRPYCSYAVFRSIDNETVTVNGENYAVGAVNCKVAARELRRAQRTELKQLRRRHRQEIRLVADQSGRRLLTAKQREERARMRYVHVQDAQRQDASCQFTKK